MFKKDRNEIAATNTEVSAEENEKTEKKSIVKQIRGIVNTADRISPAVVEIFNGWIKPIYDNRAQIARRLNAIATVSSIIFFILYVPFLLFSKIADGLSLGWEVALYTCIGVYAVTLVALLIVTIVSGKSTSTEAAKRRKRVRKVVLYVVRIASVAIAITALVITSSAKDAGSAVLSTIGIVFSIVSIIFSALPLVLGGFGGFFQWLISPAKVKRSFSFVALEWYGLITSQEKGKSIRQVRKKYHEKVSECLNTHLIPAFGEKYMKTISSEDVVNLLNGLAMPEQEIAGAILQNVFTYANSCGYAEGNPCDELGLTEDIDVAVESAFPEKKNLLRTLFSWRRSND